MPDTAPSLFASPERQAPASDDHDQRRAVASPLALAPRLDIKTTAAAAIPHLERICARWLPDGKRQGHDWIARNPTRDDRHAGSFAVSLHTGGCIDHATGEQCHDIVSTIRYLDGLATQGEAAQRVAAFIGADPVPVPTATPIAKAAPKPMPIRPRTHPKLGAPSREWEYRAGDGTLLAVVCRFETAQGKDYRPLTVTPEGWFWRAPPSPRPLYGLDQLAARPEADVLLCEGEKAADAAALLLPATVAITTMNGARALAKSDWAPLSGRRVRIWPDRDGPGHRYAATAAALAYAAGAESVAMLDLSALADDLPDGWDAADALAEGWTPERISRMATWIEVAKPSDPPVETAPLHVPEGWKLTSRMVFEINPKSETTELLPVCGPLRVIGRTNGPHGEWGLVLVFRDHDANERRLSIPAARLHEDAGILARELATLGLFIVPGREKRLLAYLASWEVRTRILSSKRLGWLADPDGALSFVMPDRVIAKDGRRQVVFQPERYSPTVRSVHASGTLTDWQAQVAATVCRHPPMLFALCAGLAPCFLTFAEAGDSFVIHFWGRTSRGKTTVGQIAASPWGCGADPNDAPERTFIRRWNLTGNGLEGLAEAHSDLPLVLDELGSSTIGDIRPLIYQLAGGQGKTALNSARDMKEPRSWRTIAISTGELSLHAKMSDPDGDGTKSRTVKGGLTHRALDIEIADIAGASPASEREGIVSNLKIACARQYGTAGPELVRCLAARFETAAQVRAWVREQIAVVMGDLAPPGLPAETARGVRRFALIAVAGEFAVRTGLIPATASQVRACVNMAVTAWLNTSAETDEERMVASVRAFILRHAARFQPDEEPVAAPLTGRRGDPCPAKMPEPVRDRVGFVNHAKQLWMFTDAGLVEAAPGNDKTTIARTLRRTGYLFTNETGKLKARIKVGESRPWLYVVKGSILDSESDRPCLAPGRPGQPGPDQQPSGQESVPTPEAQPGQPGQIDGAARHDLADLGSAVPVVPVGAGHRDSPERQPAHGTVPPVPAVPSQNGEGRLVGEDAGVDYV
ncbi:DUF927 domain-containing protein [Thiocapsa marina]|uniref:DUF927 domain-containing protein n=1 Tax=Thiocapsa marina 5811 TaxID=768671 RepID=F9U9P7_9GAMM|nr:DUF927 domain-containing protein [Thiocapsa marina]EGV18845.1 protein of unknown function DUF927 [Thiocapsa marina 5811]